MKFTKTTRCPECKSTRMGFLRDTKSLMNQGKLYVCAYCGLQVYNNTERSDRIIRAFNLMGKYKRV